MAFYRKKAEVYEAIQLNWRNWNDMCDFLGPIVSPQTPATSVPSADHVTDTCGEESPFIKVALPYCEGFIYATHGDYVLRFSDGLFTTMVPEEFERVFEKIEHVHEDSGYH